MSDQGSSGQSVEATGTGATTNEPAKEKPTTDPSVEKLYAKVNDLESDNKKYRDKLKELSALAEDRAKRAGEFEPLLKERDDEIARLRQVLAEAEPIIKAHGERTKTEEAAIAEAAKKLSDADRELVEGVSDLAKKRALVERLLSEANAEQKKAPATTRAKQSNGQGAPKPFSPFPD